MEGHGELCEWCGKVMNSLAGSSSDLPMAWSNPDRTGRTFYIHVGCLRKHIEKYKRALERACDYLAEASKIVHAGDDAKIAKNGNAEHWQEYFLAEE